ncbi:MAG: DUF1194 domain-containing protein [Rhodospirillales bacterium]|nr:DUF1194 domain-containing protein [Rhodospirillales bacterium]
MGALRTAFFVLFFLATPDNGPSAAERVPVDLELALGIDVSGSIDKEEAKVQRRGYVAAFAHPRVVRSIESGYLGRIAVSYFEWAGFEHNKVIVGWHVIHDTESALDFSLALANAPIETARRTSISGAIHFARRILDISGDGPNNFGDYVVLARDRAVAAGITINGLPVMNGEPRMEGGPTLVDLDLYFENCVIGGSRSFMVVARSFDDIERAIVTKLVYEIGDATPPRAPGRILHGVPMPALGGVRLAAARTRRPVMSARSFGGGIPSSRSCAGVDRPATLPA